jgi:hypothetical protein
VAIDGTKLAANASRERTVDYERIAREILEEAKAVDAAEDELYGEARGDELPPELATGQGRAKWRPRPSGAWTSGVPRSAADPGTAA